MPYSSRDIYRSRRKFRTPLLILLFLLAFLLVLAVVAFYGLQQFLVYDQSGVSLQFSRDTASETVESVQPTAIPTPDVSGMQVNIVFTDPSFDDIALTVGEDLSPLRARQIGFTELLDSVKLDEGVTAAVEAGCNAVVLEMKSGSGQLAWRSSTELAVSYGTTGAADFTETLTALHEQGLYVVAKLSVCADDLMAVRNWPIALRTADGQPYQDADGHYWLDPYNRELRSYIIPLMQELATMGFDEILLTDLAHPSTDTTLQYSVTLRSEANPSAAVSQLARRLAEAMQDSGTRLSVQITESALDTESATKTGQDLTVLWRLFDRIVCPCTSEQAETDRTAALAMGGSAERFVPFCTWSAPDGWDSFIYSVPSEN